ncbi:tyrosine-type recombinase/integrase [Pedobacter nanyangensis]|uniref:tyrosine-type recombinase/integrase n=1 Tax=Pedobacter nanyangensis TaxID=1562389 RepID=UPI000DE56FF9|nr:site-specific integrase [Pedobacter nanyangensis]
MKKVMKMQKVIKKEQHDKYPLGVYSGVKITLKIPNRYYDNSKNDKQNNYFLESYYNQKQKKHKEEVRAMYNDYINSRGNTRPTLSQKIDDFKELYASKIDYIVSSLNVAKEEASLNMNVTVLSAVNAYFKKQEEQNEIGQLKRIDNYRNRNKRLNDFFSQDQYKYLRLRDLRVDVWEAFKYYLLKTPTDKKPEGLACSSVNQYMVYVKSFYNWLIDVKDLNIKNHPAKIAPLDTSHQKPKYNYVSDSDLIEFFSKLNQSKYLRLHLICLLVFENNIRPVQSYHIQHQHIDLDNSRIKVFNMKKSSSAINKDKSRWIPLSPKAKELVSCFYTNTAANGRAINPEDYLLGGRNRFKSGGKPISQGDIRDLQVLKFREDYEHLNHIQIYEMKHTSITISSQEDILATQKRADHVKIQTTQIYDRSGNDSTYFSLDEYLAKQIK